MRATIIKTLCYTFVAIGAAWAADVRAQAAYPHQPIKMVVGHQAGSAPDIAARAYAEPMSQLLKQPIVVDNRAGAGGQLGTNVVAKSAGDGYTILVGDIGGIAIAPAAYARTLPYKPDVELRAVAELARNAFVFVTSAKKGAKTIKQFVVDSKSSPNAVPIGTSGPGTIIHYGAELFGAAGGFKVEPVHYRNIGEAVTAVINGDIAGAFLTPALVAPHIKAGNLQAIAISSAKRSPQLPDVETFEQAGLPGVEFAAWLTLFVPAKVPDAVADVLAQAANKVASDPAVKGRLVEIGFEITGLSRKDTVDFVRSEQVRWAEVTKKINFRAD